MRVETKGFIMGRNGLFDITAIELTSTCKGERVIIQGIGKKGDIINGGLEIEEQAMTLLATKWLAKRGGQVKW